MIVVVTNLPVCHAAGADGSGNRRVDKSNVR